MVSDRDTAKSEIVHVEQSDAELDDVLSSANRMQLELTRENNRHEEAKRDKDLGFFGKVLGGEKTAPTVVAMIAAFIGFLIASGCLIMAGFQSEQSEFWSKNAERGFAIASAAIAYIFGKNSS